MTRIPLRGGDEYDALTRVRRWFVWRAGELRRSKRSYAWRLRRVLKLMLRRCEE